MQKLLHNLNPEQLAAVTLPAQSALILAGAGSGKTRVLTTRIAWLIQSGQISPSGVLAVTFTNKAAKEMLLRLSSMLPISTRGMWIGTFHGLCNRLLRTHYRDAELPQTFQILDTQDQTAMIKRLLKSLQINDEKYPPKNVMYFINHAKEQGLRAKDIVPFDAQERQMVALFASYDEQCQREGVVDFAELMLRCYELLKRNQPLREHYQSRFRHILVDEFQDTNNLQYLWLKLLAGPHTEHPAALFAVGDDDQSIYAFRGANVGNMAAFEHEFSVQNLIKLEQNYRSHGNILDSANRLIENNSHRMGKNLRTDAGHGEPVRVYEAASDLLEAKWLIEEVKSLIADGLARCDIALLYRSNAQSRVLEHGLMAAGVPYRVYGGLRYFQRAEVKHAVAYLQLMDNPHNDSAFLRVVNFPARGIGAKTLENLQDGAKQHNISLYAAVPYMSGKAGTSLAGFVRLIEGARFEAQAMPLQELVKLTLEVSGLMTYYQAEKDGSERVENLKQLVDAASLFVTEEGFGRDAPAFAGPPSVPQNVNALGTVEILDADTDIALVMSPLSAFLSNASLEAGDNQAQVGQDALQLMTVHAAKGLEFDAVFITGLEQGLFPHESSAQERDGLEEERRLMYVAITRARKRLYLSFAQTRMLHGQTRYNVKSRFLDELPPECLKWLSAKVTQQWFGKSAWDEPSFPSPAASNANAAQFAPKGLGWRIGETVFHAKFGEGVIVNLEGGGGSPRANINFGRQGMKLLDLGVAKLERVGG
jgi:DNA helicase II / ATP-dependent DNA helicase PcrA